MVNCAARRRRGTVVRCDLRGLRTRHSSLWMLEDITSSPPCAVRESDAPLAALCCSSVRTRAPVSILLSFKMGGPEIERWIVVYPGLRYRSLASVCNARSPRIEGVVGEESARCKGRGDRATPCACRFLANWYCIGPAKQASEGARGGRVVYQSSEGAGIG